MVRLLSVLPLIAIVAGGCSTVSHDKLRTSAEDGAGPFLEDCRNVSPDARATSQPWDFYHSTWSSASVEGAAQGTYESLEEEGLLNRPAGQSSVVENDTPLPLRPYCLSFRASYQQTAEAVEKILPRLNAPTLQASPQVGLFTTAPVVRRHPSAAGKPVGMAWPAWRENYAIRVLPHGDWTVVRVTRALQISREDGVFNEAISSGHNEIWILNRIDEALLP